MDINFEWLFSFEVFAKHVNFTHAAAELHISQPALHVQIKKLSEAIGRPLYSRDGRTLTLTKEGQRLAAYGRDVRQQSSSLVQELRGESDTSPVVLASGRGAFLYLLGSAIKRFPKQKYPLRLVVTQGPAIAEAVLSGDAHLAVIGGQVSTEDLDVRELCRVGQKVVLPSGHRFAKRRVLRPQDLVDEPLIVAPPGSPHRMMITQLFESSGSHLSVAVEAMGWELMLQFVRLGMGLTVVNDFCTVPRGTVGIKLEGAPLVAYSLLSRKLPGQSKSMKLLHKLIRNELG